MTFAALDLLSGAGVLLNSEFSVNSFIIGGINTFACFYCCLLNKNLMEHELFYQSSCLVYILNCRRIGKSKDPSSTQHPSTTPALLQM